MREELLVVEDGKMRKEGFEIFRHLYLQIYKGETFGIIFDNIVERKYLLEWIKGNATLDSGRIYLNNERIPISESARFISACSAVIERTSKLIDSLSIPVNVLLFAPFMRKYVVDEKKYHLMLGKMAKKLRIEIPKNKRAAALTPKERVTVELVKAFVEGKKLVVLAGITEFLRSQDLHDIYLLMTRLKSWGSMTFVIIESFEDIVLSWTDRLAVIRNGKTQSLFKSKDTNRHQIYSALFGDQGKNPMQKTVSVKVDETKEPCPALQLTGIHTEVLQDVNFSIQKGEVAHVCFLDDLSFNHMVELIKGLRKPLSGRIAVNNQPYLINHTYQSVNKGMGWIEESPYETMFIHNMTVLDNLCLTLTKKVPQIWMKKRYLNSIRKFVSGFMDDDIAKVKPDGLPPAKLLQIAYIKWLLYAPSVVICIKPFTEVDIHLRRVTQQMIGLLQSRGIAVVIFTSNISETAPVEGETIYIRNGRVTDKDTIYQFIYGEEESSTDGPMVPRP